jgi:uncharacterized membrane protein YeaQ/YmgE (transglycosylase-associated protein family)
MDSLILNLTLWVVAGALGSLIVTLWEDEHTEKQMMRDLLAGVVGGVAFGWLLWVLQLLRGVTMADTVLLPNTVIALIGAVVLVVGVETRQQKQSHKPTHR